MKILKYIFLLLILSAIAVTVFIATQTGKYTVTQQRVINAPKEVLFGYVNDYKNWDNLSLLTGADTLATYKYSQNTTGKGASMAWEKGSVNGTINTTGTVKTDSLKQQATVDGLASNLNWAFKDTVGGTKVKVTIEGELTFGEKAQALFQHGDIDKVYEASAKRGLDNLNAFLVNELNQYAVAVEGEVAKKGGFYLGHTVTSLRSEINKNAQATFTNLLNFAKQNKIKVTGEPFIIFKNYTATRDTLKYTISIPIKDEIFTSPGSEFEGGKFSTYNALKVSLKGDYSHLPKAFAKANSHIKDNALPENPALPYIVYYHKNIKHTRRPSTWVTYFYAPVGPALVTETQTPLQPELINEPVYNGTPATTAPAKPKPAATGQSPKPAAAKPATSTTKVPGPPRAKRDSLKR